MKYTNNSLNILTCRSYKQVGNRWIADYIHGQESDSEVKSLLSQKCKSYNESDDDFDLRKERIEKELLTLEDSTDGIVAIGDENYPKLIGTIKQSEKPSVILYRGNIELLDDFQRNIAVIGLLNPTEDIMTRERKVVEQLVAHGITIVSGLALGCDSTAHKQTLDCGGKTIAILPSTLNDIIPSTNKGLAERIVANDGLLITEYYQKSMSKREMISRFIERDRLQAMFSKAVILSASYALNNEGNDSGSRHAMAKAKEYGHKRYVIYNKETDEYNKMFDLSRQLLYEDKSVEILKPSMIQAIAESGVSSDSPTLFNL